MSISNYDELKQAVQDYTLRDEIPFDTFLRLAEAKINPMIKHYLQEKTETLDIIDNTATLPADYLEGRFVSVDDKPTFQTGIDTNTFTQSEVLYKQIGNTFEFRGEYEVPKAKLVYTASIPKLTTAEPTNWLLQRFPNVYLHAVLAAAFRWLRDGEAEAQEAASLMEAASIVAADNLRGVRPANPLRSEASAW